jgi:hypothetical protein
MHSELDRNELIQRIELLQNDVRWMKRIGVAAAAVLVVLLLVLRIADHHKLYAQQVVAKDFVLIDSDGGARARLAVFPRGSGLEIYAASGERRVELIGTGQEAMLNLYIPVTSVVETASVNLYHHDDLVSSYRGGAEGASLEMHSQEARGTALLALEGTSASLTLSGADQKVPKIWLTSNPSQACTALGGMADSAAGTSLCLHSPGLPSLELGDVSGNRAIVGIPRSPDLSSSHDSAASLILKHKSGNKMQVTPH